jgi:hypothetical protein
MDTPESLPESVRRLVLPRLVLRTERDSRDERFVGIWGGIGAVPPHAHLGQSGAEHWISVDCWWLEENGFGVRGCLSVYRVNGGFVAVNDPDLAFGDSPANGLTVFGREEASWPPEGALEAYSVGVGPSGFPDLEMLNVYLQREQADCPLFRGGAAAVLGGWHFSWPDGPPRLPRLAELNARIDRAHGPGCLPLGETYRCEPYRLLLWTLRDAEPWVEVWGAGEGELHAVGRIT